MPFLCLFVNEMDFSGVGGEDPGRDSNDLGYERLRLFKWNLDSIKKGTPTPGVILKE